MKEEVQKQRVSIENISTNLMIVDPLTKGLLPNTFIKHVVNMGLVVIKDFLVYCLLLLWIIENLSSFMIYF